MKRPGKPRGQYYLSHQTTDTDCGIITGVTVTPGDMYDSVPYLEQLEHIHWNIIPCSGCDILFCYTFRMEITSIVQIFTQEHRYNNLKHVICKQFLF